MRYGHEGATELYNLKNDLYETRNVAPAHPEALDKMNKILRTESARDEHFPYAGGDFE